MNLQTKGLIMKLHKPLYFKNKILNLKMCGWIFFFFKLAGNYFICEVQKFALSLKPHGSK